MSALHRAWLHDQAAQSATDRPAPSGLQTAADWHRAVVQPPPAMQAAQARLQAAIAQARAARAGQSPG